MRQKSGVLAYPRSLICADQHWYTVRAVPPDCTYLGPFRRVLFPNLFPKIGSGTAVRTVKVGSMPIHISAVQRCRGLPRSSRRLYRYAAALGSRTAEPVIMSQRLGTPPSGFTPTIHYLLPATPRATERRTNSTTASPRNLPGTQMHWSSCAAGDNAAMESSSVCCRRTFWTAAAGAPEKNYGSRLSPGSNASTTAADASPASGG